MIKIEHLSAMKSLLFKIIAFTLLTLSAHSQKLEPGNLFPQVMLTSTKTGEPTPYHRLMGKKLMLHIFASW